jgi:putative nucleotidyltransferase with HDIG domain
MTERSELVTDMRRKAEEYALQFLKQGRAGFDVPHTYRVVHYAIELAQAGGLDVDVLALAAWFHDIGYAGLFEGDSHVLEQVYDRKAAHMVIGAERAREFLDRPDVSGVITPAQADRVVHLVSVHDKVSSLSAPDEIALMEADTLGAIDVEYVTPTFDYAGAMRYLEGSIHGKREPRFQSELAKRYLAELIEKYTRYYDALQNSA